MILYYIMWGTYKAAILNSIHEWIKLYFIPYSNNWELDFFYIYFSLRRINSISLKDKLAESVHYIQGDDKSRWAVSTTAHWQRRGSSDPEAWTCTSNLMNDISTTGGIMICVDRYDVWLTFDNTKVAEPICEKEISFGVPIVPDTVRSGMLRSMHNVDHRVFIS